ncbi:MULTISPECIES: F0F1 ATP synthase subunit A [Clostridium]|uniref:ATP synthase subunit a n=1 Tax=Clostridium manihotivorum TaxID=2320868 RepID=A0A3R5QSF1_9CLOT|nr:MULTISPECIES: F0F1 ATP synthase subunit A [Clostridium]QAA31434.1 F0F1 ATP synthase subunit A [Clostridium manihotivorum]
MEGLDPIVIYKLPLGSLTFNITLDLVIEWIVIVLIAGIGIAATRNLKKIPDKKQTVAEMLYEFIFNTVVENMGESYKSFVPYIGTLGIFLLSLNLIGLLGLQPPTMNFSTVVSFSLMTFILIHANAIKRAGFGHYLGGYAHPFLPMLPLNILERAILPVSLSLRLFGNILAATVLVDLVYQALHNISWFAQIGIPVFLHGYFDLFDGLIQMVIFVMLTMIQIKMTAEH